MAGVIVVALKGMLLQITAFWKFWKLSRMDAVVWMVTFLAVICVSIDIGLLIGILMSLISIFILGFKPYTCLLGAVPNTDLYLDINRYKGVCIHLIIVTSLIRLYSFVFFYNDLCYSNLFSIYILVVTE